MKDLKAIKGIIFDWGNVLIDPPRKYIFDYCAKTLGVSKKRFVKIYKKYDTCFQTGKISESQLWKIICSKLGVPLPSTKSLWYEAFKRAYSPRKEMFSLLQRLKRKGYKIGLLSNTEPPAVRLFSERNYKVFDVAIFSCVEKVRKPAREIYESALRKLHLKPSEVIYVDDEKRFVLAARKIGMKAILFRNVEQAKGELSHLL